ncbi:MAG: UDP-N-acetylmuramoyl-tripeptide--D-alanyl-D-alanine ligase [Anaerolineae bacterium]|nr:UDP-N-acetylmuramoyl-tripeptide--D-alanyl-D-alanine ligase [Anaerolineae bacterium]
MSGHKALTLNDICLALAGRDPFERPIPVASVVIDSRQVVKASIFVALPGEQTDGHLYVQDAFARGAMAALVQQVPQAHPPRSSPCLRGEEREGLTIFDVRQPKSPISLPVCILVDDTLAALQRLAARWRDQLDVRVVGVTGSVGKSTTKEVIAAVLAQRYRVLKSEGSFNNEIGLPLTLLQLTSEHQYAVLEMGTYGPGEITQLADIAHPQIGVVTNVGPVHLERMGTIERIVEAKSELPAVLPADGVAILNGDDARVRAMADKTPAKTFFYGLSSSCDLWADEVESLGLRGLRFRFHHDSDVVPVEAPLVGAHSVYTALSAAAVGLAAGLTWDEILAGLNAGARIRLIERRGINGSMLIDDTYNSSPDSALAALDLLAQLSGCKIAVLGAMLELGSYEIEGHHRVGMRVGEVVSTLVAVGPLGGLIADGALASGMSAGQVMRVADNEQAIAQLKLLVQPGDVILIKGSRGAKMEQIVRALAE